MSWRSWRALVATAATLAVAALVAASAASPALASTGAGTSRALLARCIRILLLEPGRGPATPVAGSADAGVLSSFAVLRRTRTAADKLPAAAQLRQVLALAGAATYDPSAAVLLKGSPARSAVYAVPATMSLPSLPAACEALPQFAGVGGYLALQAELTGSGAGVCLISTQLVTSTPPGIYLPGAPQPKPTRTLTVTQSACRSERC